MRATIFQTPTRISRRPEVEGLERSLYPREERQDPNGFTLSALPGSPKRRIPAKRWHQQDPKVIYMAVSGSHFHQ